MSVNVLFGKNREKYGAPTGLIILKNVLVNNRDFVIVYQNSFKKSQKVQMSILKCIAKANFVDFILNL